MSVSQEEACAAINLVKSIENNPCLWNYTMKSYCRSDLTTLAWKKIAAEIKDTGKNVTEYFLPFINIYFHVLYNILFGFLNYLFITLVYNAFNPNPHISTGLGLLLVVR